jgi:hypothetical protein
MLGEAVGQLGHDDDEDQVEEQLEEADATLSGPVRVAGRGLPETPEN